MKFQPSDDICHVSESKASIGLFDHSGVEKRSIPSIRGCNNTEPKTIFGQQHPQTPQIGITGESEQQEETESLLQDVLRSTIANHSRKVLSHIYHKVKYPFLVSLFLQVAHAETHSQTQCFKTVTHYYDNPEFAGGNSFLTFAYKNDDFRTVSFELHCDNPNEAQYIRLESIKLSLPADEEQFCLESNQTDYRNCSDDSHCNCCNIPKNRCSVPIEDIEDSQAICNGQGNCIINVTSKFLETCDGRKYSCENRKCHSRWAEVVYHCMQREPVTTHEVTTSSIITTLQVKSDERASWWHILLVLIFVNLIIINLFFAWRLMKGKFYILVKHHRQDMANSPRGCRETSVMIESNSSSGDSGNGCQ